MRAPFLRQSGGFYIDGGDVQLTNCNVYSNKATGFVSTRPKPRARCETRALPFPGSFSHRPRCTESDPSPRACVAGGTSCRGPTPAANRKQHTHTPQNPSTHQTRAPAISRNFLPSPRWKRFPCTFRMRAPFLRQGGGLYIAGGDVQLTNCNIYSNEARNVSTRPKTRARHQTRAPEISWNFHPSPRWKHLP